jgi:hypothetical protein
MTTGRAQPIVALAPLRARTQTWLIAVIVGGLLTFLALELLPCGGAACFGTPFKTETARTASIPSIFAAPPAADLPASLPTHPPECALHAHCVALGPSVLTLSVILPLVTVLRTGPPLTLSTWTVAPPLPPP